ncbi:MAG: DUF3891 family protein [Anaerolineae bacterium]|nr:DUF3891 family protein [Phycisphaerae bacterium]
MIRRRVGDEFWLITQHEHALLSGELARHVGNKRFDAPSESAIRGIALHDCGWPVHDDQPTLNSKHQPIDLFESTHEIGLKVWQAGSERAVAAGDDYAALLVSLHVLSLSVKATTPQREQHEMFEMTNAKTRFEVNRFQHYQIELQERLRRKLGLSIDVPMRHGLAEDATTQAELTLHFHFRMLQAMDLISLALCCTNPPVAQIQNVIPRPGARTLTVNLKREAQGVLRVSPWMFRSAVVSVSVPYRAVPVRNFESNDEFREVYRSAPIDQMQFQLRAGN